MYLFFLISISYLIGSIPSGLIISKIFSCQDPRKIGSGNIGATNVARVNGLSLGIITLVFDVSKAFLPIYFFTNSNIDPKLSLIAAFAIVLGHIFPLYLKFKGGKGVAVSIGIFFAIAPFIAILSLFIFVVLFFIYRYVSLASISSILSITPLIKVFDIFGIYNFDQNIVYFSIGLSLLVLYRHKGNIYRLINKEENKFEFKFRAASKDIKL